MSKFTFANSTQAVPSDESIPVSFSVMAGPDTDVWDKPPATSRFNAPILYRSIPLKSFKRARVSITAQWTTLYEQGGLILVLHNANGGDRKWIKTGIEFTHGKAHLSTVAKDRWADWSLLPVPSGGNAATIEVVREQDGSLWIYLVEGISRAPIREVTWAFEEEENTECWIGAFAAKPAKDGADLVVDFRHLVIETL
jgi:hypothetical protein